MNTYVCYKQYDDQKVLIHAFLTKTLADEWVEMIYHSNEMAELDGAGYLTIPIQETPLIEISEDALKRYPVVN